MTFHWNEYRGYAVVTFEHDARWRGRRDRPLPQSAPMAPVPTQRGGIVVHPPGATQGRHPERPFLWMGDASPSQPVSAALE